MRVRAGGELAALFYAHQGRLAHKWNHYLPIYERHMARFRGDRGRPVRMLEIGISQGGSLQLWRKYFGPEAIIFGVDVDPRCRVIDGSDLAVRIGSQADPEFLRRVISEMGGADIIIDDGSHLASHHRITFQTLFPLLDAHGVYIVEDLHTSYFPSYDGGVRRSGTFIEEMKLLVDDIHAWYSEAGTHVPDAEKTVNGIHFYDSIVVIEKKPKEKPVQVTVGNPSF
ncbi:MAG TPA: hypothetical protein VGZ48_10445 [Candidatus Acidoferrales bacterium]|nr:hypothetical protein [Candidatus Acidoferrales bacterium]